MTGGLLTGKGVGHLMRKTGINKFAKEYQTWSIGLLLRIYFFGFYADGNKGYPYKMCIIG